MFGAPVLRRVVGRFSVVCAPAVLELLSSGLLFAGDVFCGAAFFAGAGVFKQTFLNLSPAQNK